MEVLESIFLFYVLPFIFLLLPAIGVYLVIREFIADMTE